VNAEGLAIRLWISATTVHIVPLESCKLKHLNTGGMIFRGGEMGGWGQILNGVLPKTQLLGKIGPFFWALWQAKSRLSSGVR
jgi:hypothetical protein